jgi:hypothetical protein
MRMLLVITDSEALPAFERGFLESGGRGFTVAPRVYGRGRSGMHAGTRAHPGASSLLFTVVPEAEEAETLRFLRELRDRAGAAERTKIYALPAEDVS